MAAKIAVRHDETARGGGRRHRRRRGAHPRGRADRPVIYLEPDIYRRTDERRCRAAGTTIRPAYCRGAPARSSQGAGPAAHPARPEAELWIGAHPDALSTVDWSPLDSSSRPLPRDLGEPAVQRFGPRLPYLLKLLAARAAVLQAHPDAGAGRRRVRRRGRGRHRPPGLRRAQLRPTGASTSPSRLVALRLRGAVRVPAARRGGRRSSRCSYASWSVRGSGRTDCAARCRGSRSRRALVAELLAAGLARYPAWRWRGVPARRLGRAGAAARRVWMPRGNLHAYLAGAGVEIMAASDNVLRGGLTPKHVDVPELLRVLRFEVPSPIPVIVPRSRSPTGWSPGRCRCPTSALSACRLEPARRSRSR